jgi:hypothetical protein
VPRALPGFRWPRTVAECTANASKGLRLQRSRLFRGCADPYVALQRARRRLEAERSSIIEAGTLFTTPLDRLVGSP